MNILPSFAQITITSQNATQRSAAGSLKEYGVDFETGQFTGRLVDGAEAVKVWIWKCLLTWRFRFPIYSWVYGSELETYIGRVLPEEYIKTDVRLALEDALLINPEIIALTDFSGRQSEDSLLISFTVETIYGVVSILDYDIDLYKTLAQKSFELAKKILEMGLVRFWYDRNGRLICTFPEGLRQSLEFYADNEKLFAVMTDAIGQDLTMKVNDMGRLEAVLNV